VDAFKNYGPVPRLCIDFVADPALLRGYVKHINTVLSRLTADNLLHLAQEAQSHTLFILMRNKVEDLEDAYLAPISAIVEMRLTHTIGTTAMRHLKQRLVHSFL